MHEAITTIKLSKGAVEILSMLKVHPRQPYEEVILKFVSGYREGKKPVSPPPAPGIITTVKLRKKTAALLNSLKIHPRQSYEEVVLKIIYSNEEARKKIGQ
ncbi:hypothetical protein J4480_01610 [Candidatus Woesearchaeota archaeon]|nr:hypothetical protein [Candidatus Woesearchaeota archaeon]